MFAMAPNIDNERVGPLFVPSNFTSTSRSDGEIATISLAGRHVMRVNFSRRTSLVAEKTADDSTKTTALEKVTDILRRENELDNSSIVLFRVTVVTTTVDRTLYTRACVCTARIHVTFYRSP